MSNEIAQAINHQNPAWWAQQCRSAHASAQAAERQLDLFVEWYLDNNGKDDSYQTLMNVYAFLQQVQDTVGVKI